MGTRIHVPARQGRSFEVHGGQTIRVIDVQGQQVCDFWAFRVGNIREYVSASHTRIACGRVWLARGDALVSNLRTPLLTLVDGQEGHDLLAPCCDPERYRRDYGLEGHANCRENLFGAMKPYGLEYELVPDPVNLFERTRLGPDGEMEVVEPTTRAGDFALLRAEVDLIVAVSACPQDQNPCNGFNPTDIMIEVD
ncbi:MAG TPA: urea carboxylase-associated family protein [Chloroflexota bacterium]|nr:urea carboxylase-associated family protein [Chloroflexota bacterium]